MCPLPLPETGKRPCEAHGYGLFCGPLSNKNQLHSTIPAAMPMHVIEHLKSEAMSVDARAHIARIFHDNQL